MYGLVDILTWRTEEERRQKEGEKDGTRWMDGPREEWMGGWSHCWGHIPTLRLGMLWYGTVVMERERESTPTNPLIIQSSTHPPTLGPTNNHKKRKLAMEIRAGKSRAMGQRTRG